MPESQYPGSTLTVLGGPLDGTRFGLEETGDVLLLGSDPSCDVHVDLPSVSPLHAKLSLEEHGFVVYDTRSPYGLYVNDDRVSESTLLRDGDVLWLGEPGGPESVMLHCRLPQRAGPSIPVSPYADESAPAEEGGFFVEAAAPAAPVATPPAPTFAPPAPVAAPPAPKFVPPPVAPAAREAPVQAAAAEEASFFVEAPPPAALTEDPFFFVETPTPAAAADPVEALVFEEPAGAAPQIEAGDDFIVDLPQAAPPRPPATTAAASAPAAPLAPTAAAARPPLVIPKAASRPAPPVPGPPVVGQPPVTPAGRPASAGHAPPQPAPEAPARPAHAAPRAPRRVPAVPAPRPRPATSPALRYALVAIVVVLVVAGAGAIVVSRFLLVPTLAGVAPARAHAGQTVTLTGRRFGAQASDNSVTFNGQAARVLKADPTRLEVEVPDLSPAPGVDLRASVTVGVAGRSSKPALVAVYLAPRVHGISPDVALPGEQVELAGGGWGPGATVRFGQTPAEIVSLRPETIHVRVPELQGPPGTAASVTVVMGDISSNAAPFFLGRLPLVIGVEPAQASPGDVLTITGRGFRAQSGAPVVRVGSRRALALSTADNQLQVVVPWLASDGSQPLEVRVPGLDNVGQAVLTLAAPTPAVELRFVAEPLDEAAGDAQAALATELGPAFVLSAAEGKSAAQRALDAQARLNAAVVSIKASLEADFEARDFDGRPSLGLSGKPDALLEVAPEDAQAYGLDWTRQGAGARPPTPGRLAVWWGAVARDLVLLLVRGEAPRHALALAPEGRALLDVHQASRRAGGFGVPRPVLASLKPPQLAALRTLGLRLPAGVKEPAQAAAAGRPASPGVPGLNLERRWNGFETGPEGRRYFHVTFQGNGGTFGFEGGLNLSVPLTSVEQTQRGVVTFELNLGGSVRHYAGRWDGDKISGTVSTDPEGRQALGSFELTPE